MPMSSSPKILIVGSGPSGLSLALSLLRSGVPVRVIEKSIHPRIGQRGAGLTPRSLELFEALGIADQVLARAISVPPFRMYKMPGGVEVLKEFLAAPRLEPTPSNPYLNLALLGQENLDKILRAELEKYGCTVDIGVELQTLEQFDSHVQVKLLRHSLESTKDDKLEEGSYEWVVGADGARGAVRKQLGLSFVGETAVEQFAVGDIKIDGLDFSKWHIWGDMKNVMTSLRPTENPSVFNFIIGGSQLIDPDHICASDEALVKFVKENTGNRDDIKFGEIIVMSPYKLNIRRAESFRKGRVFLTGDAGHIHSPTGGQGMNTGLQDSFNLGWKLALVAKGLGAPSLLDTFNEERLPVVAQMLDITTKIFKQTLKDTTNESGWDRSGGINQLGVNYRWSSIVIDEEKEQHPTAAEKPDGYGVEASGPLRAGDRAPDATGLIMQSEDVGTRLFNIFKPQRHTVLIFSDKVDYKSTLVGLEKYPADLVHRVIISKPGDAVAAHAMECDVFEDRDGYAYEAYQGALGIYVIRPDGVVGARVHGSDGLHRYFQAILVGNSV